jgi:hypothetical protein
VSLLGSKEFVEREASVEDKKQVAATADVRAFTVGD